MRKGDYLVFTITYNFEATFSFEGIYPIYIDISNIIMLTFPPRLHLIQMNHNEGGPDLVPYNNQHQGGF